MGLLRTEGPDRIERNGKGGSVDPVERMNQLVGDRAVDIADEAQSQMIVLDVDPPGTR
tara:strand:- start:2995 stop:3168 length:174 start_codon:yes stop_codon:yes gene_type:complete